MTTIYAQFSDSTETTVIGYFSSPQDPKAWPNVNEIDATDPRWKAYYSLMPDPDLLALPKPE